MVSEIGVSIEICGAAAGVGRQHGGVPGGGASGVPARAAFRLPSQQTLVDTIKMFIDETPEIAEDNQFS